MSPSFNAATTSQRLDDGSIVLRLPDIRRSPLGATVLNLDDADFCRRRVFLMVPESRLRFKRTDLFFQLCPKNRAVKTDKIKASTPFLRLWGGRRLTCHKRVRGSKGRVVHIVQVEISGLGVGNYETGFHQPPDLIVCSSRRVINLARNKSLTERLFS